MMLSASSSSSISSEDRSGSSSDENSEILDDDGTAFVPYDEELEPVAKLYLSCFPREHILLFHNNISQSSFTVGASIL